MYSRFSSILSQNRLAGGAAVLALTQLAASAAGLLRDRMLFSTFPALGVTDVYFASFRPSDFLFQACIVSALGTVLVPVLACHQALGRPDERDKVLSGTMHLGALVFGVIAIVMAITLPWLAPHLVSFEGEQLSLYITFGRLALLSNFLFVFGSTLGQHLITIQKYWVYGLTPVLYTAGTIVGTVVLTPVVGPLGPMLGTLGGAVLYVLLRAAAVLHSGVRFRLTFWHPEFREMGLLMLPRVLSLGAIQLQLLLFDTLGSSLAQGSISINLAARNFQSVGVGVVGIALAQAVYSPLSQAAARKDIKAYVLYLRRALTFAVALTVPCAIALILLSRVAAGLVDLSHVYSVFRLVLIFYAVSIPFESANHLLLRSYYALRDTVLPALCAVAGGLFSVAVAWWMMGRTGIYALGIGYTCGQMLQAAGLGMFLPWRLKKLRQTTQTDPPSSH